MSRSEAVRIRRVKNPTRVPIQKLVRNQTFADLLDDALQRPRRNVAPIAPAWAARLAADVATAPLVGRTLTARQPRWLVDDTPRPPRPDHCFTSVEALAFARFAALGGALARNFSAGDLRREYRVLAQRYHPDRHADASLLDRETQASRFAEATACYRCLRSLVLQ